MNLKIYSLKIINYNDSSEPHVERYVRITPENLKYLKQEAEDYWGSDEDEDFCWDVGVNRDGNRWWSYNDSDCCYSIISEETVYLNADKSSDQKTE